MMAETMAASRAAPRSPPMMPPTQAPSQPLPPLLVSRVPSIRCVCVCVRE